MSQKYEFKTSRAIPSAVPISQALSELIALKGLGRVQGDRRLIEAWKQAAGEKIAGLTTVQGIKNRIVQIGVENSALLNELNSFHKGSLLQKLQKEYGKQDVRDIRFRLKSKTKE
jgi:predicted nucleic acid-binding Zn ribbon protein